MQLYREILNRFPGKKRAIEGLKSLTGSRHGQGQIVANAGPTQNQINGLIALYNQRRLREALVQGSALADRYPTAVVIHNIIGVVNADLGHLDQAVASYTKALRIKPDYAEAHSNLKMPSASLGSMRRRSLSTPKPCRSSPALPRRRGFSVFSGNTR
jgi:tetratricopeptide (TPR) repeat protein